MARLVRGCLTTRPQQKGAEEHERDPQQEDQQDAAKGKDIAGNHMDKTMWVLNPKLRHLLK